MTPELTQALHEAVDEAARSVQAQPPGVASAPAAAPPPWLLALGKDLAAAFLRDLLAALARHATQGQP